MTLRARVRLGLVTALTLLVALAVPGSAQAGQHDPPDDAKRELTVMTQNLYLGSSLDAAIQATSTPAFLGAVAQIYGTAVFTNFPARAEAIADTIAQEEPDLVGLQEVTRWIAARTNAGPTLPSYDFLAILQAALAARDLDYSVAVASENADIGPVPLVNPALSCAPPPSLAAVPDCRVTLQDRDVILVNDDTPDLRIDRTDTGDYTAQEELTPPVGTPVSFARGWAWVDGTYAGKRFRLVDTHLEVEGFADVQEAQAQEFLAGPARAPGAVIATGDFNSAAPPGTTTTTYADLTDHWFDDAWAVNGDAVGNTCCQNSTLTNPVSRLDSRIDLVLTHGPVRAREAHVVGDTPIAATPPLWASDHAGVVATLRLH